MQHKAGVLANSCARRRDIVQVRAAAIARSDVSSRSSAGTIDAMRSVMTKTKPTKTRSIPPRDLARVTGGFVTAECTMAKVLTPEQIAA
jgi:hypothetical protein